MTQNYLTRQDLVERLEKASKALHRAIKTRDVGKIRKVDRYLSKTLEEASVPWQQESVSWARLEDAWDIVAEKPGITFAELAQKMDLSPRTVKDRLGQHPDFEVKVRKDLKGAYGNKPYGLWVRVKTNEEKQV